jgi:hypothetical protein
MPDDIKDKFKEQLDEIEKALDKFEEEAGLPKLQKVEAPAYLTMNLADLRKKTPEELSEAVFVINQYSLYITRLINKNRAWEKWGRSRIDEISAMFLEQTDPSYGPYARLHVAKNKPDLCKKLNAFIRKVSMEAERLADIPNQLRFMADSIRDMKFSAIRKEKNYGKTEE